MNFFIGLEAGIFYFLAPTYHAAAYCNEYNTCVLDVFDITARVKVILTNMSENRFKIVCLVYAI
jgi:hypothetical protein